MKSCTFCGRTIPNEISLGFLFSFKSFKPPLVCQKCFSEFQAVQESQACPGCSRMQTNTELCTDCLKWRKYSPKLKLNHKAIYVYNEIAREYMNQYKFQGDVILAEIFSEILFSYLKPFTKTHVITTIPASAVSYQNRGFKPVDLLLKYANIPHTPILKHVKSTKPQSSKTRSERLQADQPFAVISPKELANLKKPILIVDDVYTTGRTIYHARELLEETVATASVSLFR